MGTEPREELKAKQLEKVIYFAANLVVWVDEDKRHEDLPELEAELAEERLAIEEERDRELNRRQEDLESELAEMEAEGSKEAGSEGQGQGGRQGPPVHPRAVRAGARRAEPGLGRVHQPVLPSDH